jgi:hypothetical protein
MFIDYWLRCRFFRFTTTSGNPRPSEIDLRESSSGDYGWPRNILPDWVNWWSAGIRGEMEIGERGQLAWLVWTSNEDVPCYLVRVGRLKHGAEQKTMTTLGPHVASGPF